MYEYRANLDGLHDGDTVHATIQLGFDFLMPVWIRLRDCYCPELGTVKAPIAEGHASTQAIISMLGIDQLELTESRRYFGKFGDLWLPAGKTIPISVRSVFGNFHEKYGRVLGTIWTGNETGHELDSINADLVLSGYATTTATDTRASASVVYSTPAWV